VQFRITTSAAFFTSRRRLGALAANGFRGANPPVDIQLPCFLAFLEYMMLLRADAY
jgi:hypothetical protein